MSLDFHIVESKAKMPSSCWGRYGRIGLLITKENYIPIRIDSRPKKVVGIIELWDKLHMGKTDKCAYSKARDEAYRMLFDLKPHKKAFSMAQCGNVNTARKMLKNCSDTVKEVFDSIYS